MQYALKQITPPAVEPIALSDVKLQCRIDDDTQNPILLDLIASARQRFERVTDRALISQQWRLTLDNWPSDSPVRYPRFLVDDGPYYGSGGYDGSTNGVIRLPRSPLISVESITYVDISGNTPTWDPSQYIVDTDSEPGRVTLVYNAVFPVVLPRPKVITVNYTAGYGTTAASVPAEIRERLRAHVAYCFENREQRDEQYLDSLFAAFWIGEYR